MLLTLGSFAFSCEIEAFDMRGRAFSLIPDKKNCRDGHLVYRQKGKTFDLSLSLSVLQGCEDGSLCLSLDAELIPLVPYDVRYSFASYDPVRISLRPVRDTDRIFGSCYYIGEKSDCWASAFHADSFSHLENRMLSLVWQQEGIYYHMMPLCGDVCKAEMKGDNGCLTLTCSPYVSGVTSIHTKLAVLSYGSDPYQTAYRTVKTGFALTSSVRRMEENTRRADFTEYLGWCSWEGMHLDVTGEAIYAAVSEFRDKKLPIRWILLDDGWYQENEKRQITDFREDPAKFPEGLRAFTDTLKREYGMKYVGIWESYAGGWYGIAPGSRAEREFAAETMKLSDSLIVPRTDAKGSFAYWNRRHRYLSECGFDFVKVDVECQIETCMQGAVSIGEAARGAHMGLDASVGLYFDGACIHCTGMGAENLWNRPVGMINRNSSDFSAADVRSMRPFLNDNLYNSFFHSHFTITDWDMMGSGGTETARQNAVLHAICGGPVYLADPIGAADPDVILPFCDSEGKLYRCDGFAMPTEDRLFVDPQTKPVALKAWNRAGNAGVIGVFHTASEEKPFSDCFRVSDVPGMETEGESFLVYDWYGKEAQIVSSETEYGFTLSPFDAKLYLIVPFTDGIALLGLKEKYIAPAAIETTIREGKDVTCLLREGGVFAFAGTYEEVLVNGKPAAVKDEGLLHLVDCADKTGRTLITIRGK